MANIYYCYSETHGTGTLRAALTSVEGRTILEEHPAHYAGVQFPKRGPEPETDSAVLRLFEEERNEQWQTGFYRFNESILRIEEAIHDCDAKRLLPA